MDATPLRLVSGLVLLLFVCSLSHFCDASRGSDYYGAYIGPLNCSSDGNQNVSCKGIKGVVYGVDDSTFFIKGFTYDGAAIDVFFWANNGTTPGPNGYIIPYPPVELGREPQELQAYHNADIILELPAGKKIRNANWLSLWCRRFAMSVSSVPIPQNITIPKVRMLAEFTRLAHGLRSGNISILDSRTFYIPNLHYDGAGPDAYFMVGNGTQPHAFGVKVPNQVQSLEKLGPYQGQDIEIVLPDHLTVYDIDWLAVWCVEYRHNFGHVMIPKDLDVPPALGQTKITPHWWYNPTSSTLPPLPSSDEQTDCIEMLDGRVQVQWVIMGDDIQIKVSGRIREDQYIAFGLSGSDDKPEMLGGDVVVVAYDNRTGKFIAEDYYMSGYAQCNGLTGVCPDERIGGKNDAVYVHGERKNGITRVTYRRPLQTNEPERDRMIPTSETSVIAAIGRLNTRGEANAHDSFDKTTGDIRIDFTSRNVHKCTNSLYNVPDMSDVAPWPPMSITNETTFTARIGPTGGKRGYSRITGLPSWGIAWYINDLLIPELTVERGKNYTFIVEGGKDPTNIASYHPFYITDSKEGGYDQKSNTEKTDQKVYAGVKFDAEGYPYPTAVGRYCEWKHKTIDMSLEMETFENFFETLQLVCDKGEPAELHWTVAEDTPDVVYYQCYSHRNMGWKINVIGGASTSLPIASMVVVSLVLGLLNLLR
nr:protein Skeletor, isoforms B/C isoform X1 [Megalopta genalis]XP_033323001.1 protein Skeletor, isoforms B/C isoform X2 [Megalopta genalis]XP_033323002.1 protein Skeletor, isoforms B/C isoform X1 [Megalopta genalis]XP_033323003.1 protein Skeletor, isoforms B/C isoform X1 [Megalopta genalis]XP_033323005.1 protein Skeletor, isoforms B/C isoform X1 [Megalopta genalis]XP_033323006.1 protein Skeletor, isoforms B/C isoform X1 [Megalopta genalis]XP_033323007.1 protein Skeletor, isoforms B/C isoform